MTNLNQNRKWYVTVVANGYLVQPSYDSERNYTPTYEDMHVFQFSHEVATFLSNHGGQ